jgi:hypothetical protein
VPYRCDLLISLATGQPPVFFQNAAYESRRLGLSYRISYEPEQCKVPIADDELAKIWATLADFCTLVNNVQSQQQKISTELFLDTMTLVMYQLLPMRALTSPSDRVIRLAMLLFAAQAFLQWRELRLPLDWVLSESVDAVLHSHDCSMDPRTSLWVATILRLALPSSSTDIGLVDACLVKNLEASKLNKWSDVKVCLASYLWIDIISEQAGRKLFNELCSL